MYYYYIYEHSMLFYVFILLYDVIFFEKITQESYFGRFSGHLGFGGHLGFFREDSTDKITCYIPKYQYTKNGAFIRSVTVIPLSHPTI